MSNDNRTVGISLGSGTLTNHGAIRIANHDTGLEQSGGVLTNNGEMNIEQNGGLNSLYIQDMTLRDVGKSAPAVSADSADIEPAKRSRGFIAGFRLPPIKD